MKYVIGFIVLILVLLFTYSTALAERKVEEGIEYWTKADSNLTPKQLISWMRSQPTRLLIGGLSTGLHKEPVEFGIFEIKAPYSNSLQIKSVRLLLHKHKNNNKPYTLVGYTILYTHKNTKSYKIHTKQWKYMLYDYVKGIFKHEKSKPKELPQRIPTIPRKEQIEI